MIYRNQFQKMQKRENRFNLYNSVQMKKQLCNEQITRIIQRENVITFKRKNEPKTSVKSQKQQDEEETKSNPNEDNSFHKNTKRNMPLPEINRERKRLALRASEVKSSNTPVYADKEVRQRDNLMLKNANNHLTNENLKLKTKNMNLEKQLMRLQKMIEEDPQKGWGARQGRHPESSTLKIVMKNLKKELEDTKKENSKIKTSIKFTTINELEVEREFILEESQRLREMLEEERNRCNYLKMSQQTSSQQEFKQLQDRNFALMRENSELKNRISKNSDEKGASKHIELEKNISRQLLNARNAIKEKDKQLEYLKQEIKKLSNHESSLKVIETHALHNSRSREIKSEMTNKEGKSNLKVKEKRLMSKSAQKYRTQITHVEKHQQCENCKALKQANNELQKKLQEMSKQIQKLRSGGRNIIEDFSRNPIKLPSEDQILQVRKFLIHRFKAHHLTLEEAAMHLLNIEGPSQLQADVNIAQLLQISMTEPFSVLSDRYIETFICQLCYRESSGETITIEQNKTFKKKTVRENFLKLIGEYEIIPQNKEDQMFIQIAELITNYQQHIHKALNERRNTESTVPERDFYDFFKEIELEPEYIDFMVSQIILESLDLDHLNIYNLFEIFFMPKEEEEAPQGLQKSNKPKYKMIDTVVKEVDEEYEESKSFLESKQKSISKQEEEPEEIGEAEEYEEQYEDQFEQEKKQSNVQEPEAMLAPEKKEPVHEQFQIEDAEEEYIEDYES